MTLAYLQILGAPKKLLSSNYIKLLTCIEEKVYIFASRANIEFYYISEQSSIVINKNYKQYKLIYNDT